MKFSHINRRTHLYLGLALLPWFLMYAVTSIQFSHPDLFGQLYEDRKENWQLRFEKDLQRTVPPDADPEALRAFAVGVLADNDIDCSHGVSPVRGGKVDIWCASFLAPARLVCDLDKKRVKVEDKIFRVDHFLGGMHARGGFQHDGFLDDLWAVIVDVVCLSFVIWVASGLYMWWCLPRLRRWGAVALLAGAVTFGAFMVGL